MFVFLSLNLFVVAKLAPDLHPNGVRSRSLVSRLGQY